MTAIAAIDRVRAPLLFAEGTFVALFVLELFYLRSVGTFEPGRAVSALIIVPPLGATICFFPLCYLAWFRKRSPSVLHWSKAAFFWLCLGVAAFVWGNIIFTTFWLWR